MYQCILFIIVLSSQPFQYRCEIQDLKIYLQAIIMPFDNLRHTESNRINKITETENNSNQNGQNIKAKTLHMTIKLKRNKQVKYNKTSVFKSELTIQIIT